MSSRVHSIGTLKKLAFVLPIVMVGMLSLANIIVSSELVSHGQEIAVLEREAYRLTLERKDLESNMSKSLSLHQLQVEAELSGYIPVRSVTYIEGSTPVALR